ncbi:hypothetical protein BH09CHL1_BH09CHL1_11220 [soil metagenome]
MFYWIGGSPCSGKSTIANSLAEKYGMTVYRCDDAYYEHAKLITPENQPIFTKLTTGTADEIWLRPVDEQVREELGVYREEFPFILKDLEAFSQSETVLLEGAALLPELLAAHGIEQRRCIWIVPTEEFQNEHYAQRDWRHGVLAECSDPEQGWQNWMARDAGFAAAVAQSANSLGFRVIIVDGKTSIADNLQTVESHFRLSQKPPIAS